MQHQFCFGAGTARQMSTRKAIVAGAVLTGATCMVVGWAVIGRSAPQPLSGERPEELRKRISGLVAQADTPEGMRRLAQAVEHKDSVVACAALRTVAARNGAARPLEADHLEIVKKATTDKRPEVSHTAIQVLEATTPPAPEDPAVPEFLLKLFVAETSPDKRAAAAQALGKLQHWSAMEPLLDALEDDSAIVRGAAGVAIREILGLDFGFRADAPEPQRAAVLARMREYWKLQLPFHLDYVRRLREQRKANP